MKAKTLTPWDEKKRKHLPAEEALARVKQMPKRLWDPENIDKTITLENIKCVDSRRRVITEYSVLPVHRDYFRYDNGEPLHFGLADALQHAGRPMKMLPTMAVTCNILARLYEHRGEPEARQVLDLYKLDRHFQFFDKKLPRFNQFVQATVVANMGSEYNGVIHLVGDFVSGGDTEFKVAWERRGIQFNESLDQLMPLPLEQAVNQSMHRALLMDLTGLEKPEVLLEIAAYLGGDIQHPFPSLCRGLCGTVLRHGIPIITESIERTVGAAHMVGYNQNG